MTLLSVTGLKKYHYSGLINRKEIRAVDGVDFEIGKGKALGLVGNSGCGKTTVARTVLRLTDPTAGNIVFEGMDITRLKGRSLKPLGRRMQIIFQNPESSLNPAMKVYDALLEPLRVHKLCNSGEEEQNVRDLIETVNLNEELLFRYPHELSGGQLQRVVIARVLSLNPKLIVADEVTSMLDPLVQSQILNLLKDLQNRLDISYLFISHDMNVVEWMCDDIAVMDKGKIVEWK
ncbi:dipeptide/oligopeptide/nickel ABC transporter ATP-binding protein [uncultured Methanolobus sp.]|uniref:dipeptide/oligopeptide/nickel ABC transporter ATP-binding protein n=1 Tax=uncultured Methanolobus sp. TaxID=218300 RepID=UPI002AABB8F8|nr:dipeptide/oligopeptide/nickel ABC transporter ATP-binding protein [uncultured Methanolobus sp.]